MPVEIKVPQLGESIVEATVGQWLKREGDAVARDEPVAELETDKVNIEVAAPEAGVLERIVKREGETVAVGDVIAMIGAGQAAGAARAGAQPGDEQTAGRMTTSAQPQGVPPASAQPDAGQSQIAPSAAGQSQRTRAGEHTAGEHTAGARESTQAAPPQHDGARAEPSGPARTEAAPPDRAAAPDRAAERRPTAPEPPQPAAAPGVSASPLPVGEGPGVGSSPPSPAHGRGAGGEGRGAGGEGRGGEGGPATPLARRMAAEHGIDLGAIAGTGAGGRITHDDVAAYLAAPAAPAAQPTTPAPSASPLPAGEGPGVRSEERVRMSRRRLTIARRLVEAQRTAAMLTTFNEVDMGAILDLRQRRQEAFQRRYAVRLGFMSFFVKASVAALKDFPRLNAELQGEELVLKRYYDIGVAVSTDEGLVVPVVRDADRLSFAAIERAVADLAQKARNRTLALADLAGGTFTITNGGVFGSLLSTPILNGPQVGILGLHKVEQRPIARDGRVIIRPMMYVALSYDHRVVDGAESVSFLVRIKELLEDPEALLLEA